MIIGDMENLLKHRALLMLIAGLLLFFCVLVIFMAFSYTRKAPTDDVYEVARQLGYTEQTHLVQTEQCWDIFPSHCGVFIHFTTDMSLDQYEEFVDMLNFSEDWFGEIDGYSIFTNINLESDRTLTANGNDGLANRLAIRKPLAYQWSLTDGQNRNWNIYFYQTAGDENEYKIDDQLLFGNIVTVMLQTK